MTIKKFTSWLLAFVVLGAYTGSLVFAGPYQNDSGVVHAQEIVVNEADESRPGFHFGRSFINEFLAWQQRHCNKDIWQNGKKKKDPRPCRIIILPFPTPHIS